MSLIDTHCHLTHPRFSGDLDAILERAVASGVAACVTIGTGVEDARKGLNVARRHPGRVFCAAGIDPFTSHAKGEGFAGELRDLELLLGAGGFVAVGEVGLDYHYALDPPAVQIERLESQLDLAARLDLPVVIHVREAHDDMRSVLGGHPRNRGVIHSFTGGPRETDRYLEIGWHLAFNGVVTFASGGDVREAVRRVPLERMLLETDAPYLAPAPRRGARCEPAFVAHTCARIGEILGIAADEIAARTGAAAARLFALPTPVV